MKQMFFVFILTQLFIGCKDNYYNNLYTIESIEAISLEYPLNDTTHSNISFKINLRYLSDSSHKCDFCGSIERGLDGTKEKILKIEVFKTTDLDTVDISNELSYSKAAENPDLFGISFTSLDDLKSKINSNHELIVGQSLDKLVIFDSKLKPKENYLILFTFTNGRVLKAKPSD